MRTQFSGVNIDMSRRTSLARRRFLADSGRLTLAVLGLAAGLSDVRTSKAASQVTIGVTETPCIAPAYIAVSQGFLKDEGLDATVVDLTTPGNLGRAIDGPAGLTGGRVDAVMSEFWSAVPPRMPTGLKLGDLVLTAALQRGCVALVVTPDSPIQSLTDLSGQKVAGARFLFSTPLADAGLNPDTDITWGPAPSIADQLMVLQSGDFSAVQTINAQGVLLERAGQARMIAMNNMPPVENDYCCGCMMQASSIQRDKPKAAAITRALMRSAAWSEVHRAEVAQQILPLMVGQGVNQEDMEAALDVVAFVPLAEAARPILVDEFERYLRYGLPVAEPMDATTLVSRIFVPMTDEISA
jgi:ABC-type nitrate/sulfonate/bicarbonate transport system substrate-binding protein